MKSWVFAAALAVLPGTAAAGQGVLDEKDRAAVLVEMKLYRDTLLPDSQSHPITLKYGPLWEKHEAAVRSAESVTAYESAKKGYARWKSDLLKEVRVAGYKPGPEGETLTQFQERIAGEVSVLSTVRQMHAVQKAQAELRAAGDLRAGFGFDGSLSPYSGYTAFAPSGSFSMLAAPAATDGAVRADVPAAGDPARYDKIRRLLLSKGVDRRVIDAAIAEGLKRRVDPMIVLSVIDQESNFRRTAYNHGSGCAGLMQLDPATAADMGVRGSLYDIKNNIYAGVKYIDWIANKFFKMDLDLSDMAAVPADKLKMILASYNWGIGNVQRLIRKHGVAALDTVAPRETRNYIAEIPGRIRSWFASL